MPQDVSIVFSASDRLSDSIRKMRSNVRDLSKDVKEYQSIQQEAFQKRAEIKLDITQAKKELQELTKAVRQDAEGAKDAFLEKQKYIDQMTEEYRRLGQVVKDAAKEERLLQEQQSKNQNGSTRTGTLELWNKFANSELTKMLGGSVANALGSSMTSTYGSGIGSALTSIGSNAVQGYAYGGVAGAAVGAVSGIVQAATQYQEKRDDAYRQEVENLYQSAITNETERLNSGVGIAATRENYNTNFRTLAGEEEGQKLYEQLVQYGDATPYDTTDMLGAGMEMMAYGIAAENVMEYMQLLGDIAMGDKNKLSGLSYAFSQSMNAKTLNGQDRRQMLGYGFDPLEYVAKNLGIEMAEAMDMMSEGQITSDMLVDALRTATAEGERFYGAIDNSSTTYSGLSGQLESAQNNLDAAMGEGYNNMRKEGMQEELEQYSENDGILKEMYAKVGEYEALQENKRQQEMLDAMKKAAEEIQAAGLEGEEALEAYYNAYADAQINYNNSELAMSRTNAEKGLVENIQGKLVEDGTYVDFGREMAEQFSLGWSGGIRVAIEQGLTDVAARTTYRKNGNLLEKIFFGQEDPDQYAVGLPRVPYDNFPALLHEGERVLTRQEANTYAAGGGGVQIAKLADSIVVREEADIEKIAAALVQNLRKAQAVYGG